MGILFGKSNENEVALAVMEERKRTKATILEKRRKAEVKVNLNRKKNIWATKNGTGWTAVRLYTIFSFALVSTFM